jgi:type II secretory pathway component PulK
MRFRKSQRGAALILVLWCLIVMGMAVLGAVAMLQLAADHSTFGQRQLAARAAAASGLALGLQPKLAPDDPLLRQTLAPGEGYEVSISSEGARLNLNRILKDGHVEILERLFTGWGVKPEQAEQAAACLYDWTTPGDRKSLAGAKAEDYARARLPQRPTGAPFSSLDEVAGVIGMNAVARARPDWRESFTLCSSGPLDVTQAPADLIAAVTTIAPAQAAWFTQKRNGHDGIAGTADDLPVPDLKTFQTDLGLSDAQIEKFADEISFGDSRRHIESTGTAGGVRVVLEIVTELNSAPVRYFSWNER